MGQHLSLDGQVTSGRHVGQYLALFVSGLTRVFVRSTKSDPLANGLTNWPIPHFAGGL